jgi:phosphonate transport system substrate-binding protein
MLLRFLPLLICLLLGAVAQARPLVLAQVSDRATKDYEELRPMVQHVAAGLSDFGITSGEVRLYPTAEALVNALRNAEVDWVTETPFTAARLVHEARARPLLRKWKRGQREYRSIIYTRADSPVRTLDDLVGQSIAFEHADSFSSYFLPRSLLEQGGFTLRRLENLEQRPAPGQIGYLFSRNEKNNALWVHKSLTVAGALNGNDWNNPQRVPEALRSQLRIIHRSAAYPRALELTSASLEPALAEALRALLLDMTPDNAPELLQRYEQTTGFGPVQAQDIALLSDIYRRSRAW